MKFNFSVKTACLKVMPFKSKKFSILCYASEKKTNQIKNLQNKAKQKNPTVSP